MKNSSVYVALILIIESLGTTANAQSTVPSSHSHLGLPIFPGLTLAVATGETELTLAWLPATDESTPTESILYRIHLSTIPNFEPSPTTLRAMVIGDTTVDLIGLDSGTNFHILVVAEDGSGNRSREREYKTVSTPGYPVLLSGTTLLQRAGDLGLGRPISVQPDLLIFENLPGSTPPAVGAILVGSLVVGGYLRRVESVTQTASGMEVVTSDPPLQEAVEQIDIASNATVHDPRIAGRAAPRGKAGFYSYKRSLQPDGSVMNRTRWKNRQVSIERVGNAFLQPELRLMPQGFDKYSVSLGDDLEIDLGLSFMPEVATDAEWTLSGVHSARVIARGSLEADIRAEYDFEAAASYAPDPFPLFITTWTSVYSVGPVPIYQQITLSVEAEVVASASASINAVAAASASAAVEIGVEYTDASGWQPIAGFATDRSFSTSLDIAGTAEAEIRLVPELSVEFYELLTGRISVEPYLRGQIAAQDSTESLCLPLEISEFNLDLGVDCLVGIDFSPFSQNFTLWEGTVCALDWPLFSLPEFSLESDGSGPVTITTNVSDGINNPLEMDSILWDVQPSSATITPGVNDNTVATVECSADDVYTVTLSGFGRLGELARQCADLQMPCSSCPEPLPGGAPVVTAYSCPSAIPSGGQISCYLYFEDIDAGVNFREATVIDSVGDWSGSSGDPNDYQPGTRDLTVGQLLAYWWCQCSDPPPPFTLWALYAITLGDCQGNVSDPWFHYVECVC